MTMFELPVERTPDRIDPIRTWVPRIAMSLFFLSFGSQKFTDPYWMGVFATIGFGACTGVVGAGILATPSPTGAFIHRTPRTSRTHRTYCTYCPQLCAARSRSLIGGCV